jgi:hypothetical protein
MNKLGICIVACMFLVSMIAVVAVENEECETKLVARKYVENRPIVPVYTEDGLEWFVNEKAPDDDKGKPEKPGKPDKPGKPPKDPPQDETEPDGELEKYALCIGISNYQGSTTDLQYCDDDANDWKAFLNSYDYSVKTLIDRRAKFSNIESEIDNLLAKEDGDDIIVITYSGHGTDWPGAGSCIISHDNYLISHGWFKSKLDAANSPNVYFAFDACEIGDFKDSVTSGREGAFASNNEYAWDGESWMQNGVFTYYQMEGWNTYDNFEEDGDYAKTQMENWASGWGITVDPFYDDNYTPYLYP